VPEWKKEKKREESVTKEKQQQKEEQSTHDKITPTSAGVSEPATAEEANAFATYFSENSVFEEMAVSGSRAFQLSSVRVSQKA
jgi:hypothetical protein